MVVDRRKRRLQQARSGNRRSGLILLTVVVVLLAMGGALWALRDPTPAPAAVPVAASMLQPSPTPLSPAATPKEAPLPSVAVAQPSLPVGPEVDQLAPDFKLKDLEGQQRELGEFRGKVVLLNFWATWCGPCRVEIPDIRTVYTKYKEQGFIVLAVDIGETSTTVAKFARQFDMSFPVLLDSNMAVSRQYETFSIPSSFFLDRRGVIREARIGTMSQSYIEQVVSRLLKEP